MRLSGSVSIEAPRWRVWDFLTDPHQVGQCAPGVAEIEVSADGRKFRATAAVGFGTVTAKFAGEAEWLERDAPRLARLRAHGTATGGSAADVVGQMQLSDDVNGATLMTWTSDVTVLGQLSSLAARLMKPVSQKVLEQFYACLKQKIEAGQDNWG